MTIAKVIKSLVPITIILRDDIFTLFANKCSNSLKSVEYYINHPNKISTDLDISHPDVNKFINWLLDDYNLSDLSTLLFSTEQIKIVDNDKKFDGAPIFRNKLICITGKFIHGDVSEITAILQSYSAKVTTEFSNSVDCIITGSTMEGINGVMLKNAQILGVPVFDEVGFFNQYEIDSDLKENLL
jgi:NAD-dependent DNA ligase